MAPSRSGVWGFGFPEIRDRLKQLILAPFWAQMGPHLGPFHPLLVPFGTPSGPHNPLSHRGRVSRGVLIPMCHGTNCSSDPFILTPTRWNPTGYGSSGRGYAHGVTPFGTCQTSSGPPFGPFWCPSRRGHIIHTTIHHNTGSQRGLITAPKGLGMGPNGVPNGVF